MARVYLPLLLMLASACTHSERHSSDRVSTALGKPSDTQVDLLRGVIELLSTVLERLWMEYMGSRDGCIHECPRGMELVASKIRTAPDGCGAFGIQLGVLSTVMALLPDVESCCNEHDKCYDTCNMSKARCDVMFHDCLKTLCTEFRSSADALYGKCKYPAPKGRPALGG